MKSIYDYSHVKSVSAIGLLYKGKQAGKIIANWSDNPAGSVCTVCVMVWEGPLKIERTFYDHTTMSGERKKLTTHIAIAKAGGGGYCKISQGIGEILKVPELSGAGIESVRKFFESKDYKWFDII